MYVCNVKSNIMNLTFKSLFKPAIAKKVLLYYLDQAESNRLPLLDYRAKSDEALLAHLRVYNPEFTYKQVLQAFGLKKALEIYTIRELRALFGNSSSRSWYRLMVDARSVKLPQTHSPLSAIRESIIQFKPTKLSPIKIGK